MRPGAKRRGASGPPSSKKRPKIHEEINDEIESPDLSENEEAKDDFFVAEESAAEKELRMAKELIKRTQDAIDSDEDEDAVREKLQQEAVRS